MRMVTGRMTRKTWLLNVRRKTWKKKAPMTLKQTRPQKETEEEDWWKTWSASEVKYSLICKKNYVSGKSHVALHVIDWTFYRFSGRVTLRCCRLLGINHLKKFTVLMWNRPEKPAGRARLLVRNIESYFDEFSFDMKSLWVEMSLKELDHEFDDEQYVDEHEMHVVVGPSLSDKWNFRKEKAKSKLSRWKVTLTRHINVAENLLKSRARYEHRKRAQRTRAGQRRIPIIFGSWRITGASQANGERHRKGEFESRKHWNFDTRKKKRTAFRGW